MKDDIKSDGPNLVLVKTEFQLGPDAASANYSELKRLWDYYLRLFVIRFRKNYNEEKIVKIIHCILNLLSEADSKKLVVLSNLKNESDVHNFLQEVSGLNRVKQWLKTRPAERIIKLSGKEKLLVNLWDVNINNITSVAFSSLDNLKKEVDDLFVDFKLVFFFLDRSQKWVADGDGVNRFSNVLEIRKIFINFLVSLTLEIEKDRFSIDEYYLFLRKTDDFNLWLTDINQKAGSFSSDTYVADVMRHREMILIINSFKDRNNYSMFFSEIKSLLMPSDRSLLDKLETELAIASNFLVTNRLDTSKKGFDARQKDLIKKVNNFLFSQRIDDIYNWLLNEHRFLPWISNDFLKMIIVYDRFCGRELVAKYSAFSLSEYDEINFGDFSGLFQLAANNDQPFELSWNFLRRGSDPCVKAEDINKSIFSLIFSMTDIHQINSWLSVMIDRDELLEKLIPSHFFLAIYLTDSANSAEFKELKNMARRFLTGKPWFKYLAGDCVRSYFNHETQKSLENKLKQVKK